MQPLRPLQLPLGGCLLLEASAGTGKTFTLALLFLRILLEQGRGVDQILVVTFTRAATSELRDRIRRRIREALAVVDGQVCEDPLLEELLAPFEQELARQRLLDALVRMDEAAIYTIHGYCQRMLQEHAFESGSGFVIELMENDLSLRQEIIEDFWRNRFYPAGESQAAWALATFGDPAGLLKALDKAATTSCILLPEVDAEAMEMLRQQTEEAFGAVQQILGSSLSEVEEILLTDDCLLRNEKAYRADQVALLVAALEELAACSSLPSALPPGAERLAPSVMATHLKKKCQDPPAHPLFHAFERLYTLKTELDANTQFLVLREARAYLQHTLVERKAGLGLVAFDDLLSQLDAALSRPESGQQLAIQLRQRYPVALVDEFQDTDPVQYRVFSKIYRREQGTLCMIGDPKQAIYSFRGADIFTYMRAREETDPASRYTMETNYRSTPAMVEAVNAVFGLRSDAFVFSDAITFLPVQAAPTPGASLLIDGATVLPLQGLLLDRPELYTAKKPAISKERAQQAAVQFCSDQITRLLELSREGRATYKGRALATADIAILVRTHREAEAMQAGLAARGINALSLGQDSVFASDEARQLDQVLAALVDGGDAGRIRTCLATDLFGCSAEEIHAFQEDDQAWSQRMASLQFYRQLWQEQGIMPMFQHLLVQEGVTNRLTGRLGGERSLTNYLHLAELLQESPAGVHGAAALLRWYRHQLEHPDAGSEAQLVRLENDEDLIRIVTVHRAKGLEFPLVFLPFLWNGRPLAKDAPVQFHDRQTKALVIDLRKDAEHRTLAEEERLAEELRLLYVALTRSKSCCYFCWGKISSMELSGLAFLLHGGSQPPDEAAMCTDLEKINENAPLLALSSMPEHFVGTRLSLEEEDVSLAPLHFGGRILPGWTMTSYSRLSSEGKAHLDLTEWEEPRSVQPPPAEDFRSPFSFPRGAAAGTCLHALFEHLDFQTPVQDQEALIVKTLEQGGFDLRWQEGLQSWLSDILAVELPGACPLRQLTAKARINELNFLFPLEQVQVARFNDLLHQVGFTPLALSASTLQGLMKGFIDLVFRHQGRYCIVDYKSNYLGASLGDYGPDSLLACMESHQYHLQLLIYTIALHRFLKTRVRAYDYDEHIGHVYYLFLRGMSPDGPPESGVYSYRPTRELVEALDRCCQGGE
nr:exodeoxyribonuclease V subunit beta [uncultured Desulfobulbus sp.]